MITYVLNMNLRKERNNMTMNTILSTMLLSDALYAIALGAILSIVIRKYIRRSNWQLLS